LGKGFREPSLYELFSGKTSAVTDKPDTVTRKLEPEGQSRDRDRDSALQVRRGKSYNVGVVWSPKVA